jgi:hypothetical protein
VRETRTSCRILVRKPLVGRRKWEINIQMDLREVVDFEAWIWVGLGFRVMSIIRLHY